MTSAYRTVNIRGSYPRPPCRPYPLPGPHRLLERQRFGGVGTVGGSRPDPAPSVAGALLVFCYLVVAPSTALLLSRKLRLVLVMPVPRRRRRMLDI